MATQQQQQQQQPAEQKNKESPAGKDAGKVDVAVQKPEEQGASPAASSQGAQRQNVQQSLRPQGVQQGTRSPAAQLMRRMRERWPSPFDMWSSDPFEMMQRMTSDFDRMFDELGFGRAAPSQQQAMWSPQIEMFERGDELVVRADVPGLKREDLTIEVIGNNLVIEGERKSEHEEQQRGYFRSEREYGQFRRVIALPESANVDDAQATFDGGVLEIKVKNAQRQGRRIEIGAGSSSETKKDRDIH